MSKKTVFIGKIDFSSYNITTDQLPIYKGDMTLTLCTVVFS